MTEGTFRCTNSFLPWLLPHQFKLTGLPQSWFFQLNDVIYQDPRSAPSLFHCLPSGMRCPQNPDITHLLAFQGAINKKWLFSQEPLHWMLDASGRFWVSVGLPSYSSLSSFCSSLLLLLVVFYCISFILSDIL